MLRPACPPLSPAHRRPSITLACKRCARLFYAEPRLWRSVSIVPDPSQFYWGATAKEMEEAPPAVGERKEAPNSWLQSKYLLLRRVAPVVEGISLKYGHLVQHAATAADSWEVRAAGTRLCSRPPPVQLAQRSIANQPTNHPPKRPSPSQVHHFLRLLHPECLRELSLDYLTKKVEPAVARLTSLTKLHFALRGAGSPPPPSLAALLRGMSSLRDLSLEVGMLEASVVAAIARMTQLTTLSVSTGWHQGLLMLPAGSLEQLAGSLRELSLKTRRGIPPLTVQCVAALAALTSVTLASPGGDLLSPAMLSPLSALHQLRRLALFGLYGSGDNDGGGLELSELQQHLADIPSLSVFTWDSANRFSGNGITASR